MQSPPPNPKLSKAKHNNLTGIGIGLGIVLWYFGLYWYISYADMFFYNLIWPDEQNHPIIAPLRVTVLLTACDTLFPAVPAGVVALLLRRKTPFVSRGLWIGSIVAPFLLWTIMGLLRAFIGNDEHWH